jgi:Clostripain family
MSPKNGKASKLNEWTVMFFCAGDNELAPLIVSQLKGIKEAGPHPDVDVLVYVDPNEKGVPTRVYCVNQDAEQRPPSRSPFIFNMEPDTVDFNGSSRRAAAKKLKAAIQKPDSVEVNVALRRFLLFAKENHRAKHYALILLGHGMIVANDAFLPDEFPVSSITLRQFANTVNGFGGKLELLALHSCSMSAVEVAYELRGKANYLMASEGLSFVGSWPYRQLMMRVFNFIDQSRKENAKAENFTPPELIESLYKLSFHNAKDFMLSGYSLDLALCSLDPERYQPLTTAIRELVRQLKKALNVKKKSLDAKNPKKPGLPTRFIQVAHLESQSYFDENYTDLFDFCLCLSRLCESKSLKGLRDACDEVIKVLEPKRRDTALSEHDRVVVHSRHFGSHYQHSHGLSIYFPWSPPLGHPNNSVMKKYKDYAFSKALGERNSWLKFLELYLKKTTREGRSSVGSQFVSRDTFGPGTLSKPSGGISKPSGGSGATCSCPSIKNFPTEERKIKGKTTTLEKFAMA